MNDSEKRSGRLQQLKKLWEQRIECRSRRITLLPIARRPRQKLLTRGADALSDLELVAVMPGKGTRWCDVFSLATRVLQTPDEDSSRPNVVKLLKIGGVGPAKAALVAAAMELARRRIHPRGFKISNTPDFTHWWRKRGNDR